MPWWSGLLCDRYQSPVSLVPRAFACTCWGHRSEWPSMSYQASRCDGGIQCLPAAVAVSRVIISCNGVKTSTSGHIVTTLLLNPAPSNHAKWCFHWAVKLFFELLQRESPSIVTILLNLHRNVSSWPAPRGTICRCQGSQSSILCECAYT